MREDGGRSSYMENLCGRYEKMGRSGLKKSFQEERNSVK